MQRDTIHKINEALGPPFCRVTFFSWQLSWATEDPVLSSCMEHTVMVWIPTAFHWTFSIVVLLRTAATPNASSPWTILLLTKIAAAFLTAFIYALLASISLIQAYRDRAYLAGTVLRMINSTLTIGRYIHNSYSLCPSSFSLFTFWTLCMCSETPRFYRIIRTTFADTVPDRWEYVDEMDFIEIAVTYPLLWLNLGLNSFAEEMPTLDEKCPVDIVSPLLRFQMDWQVPTVIRGYMGQLTPKDLFPLPQYIQARVCDRKYFEARKLFGNCNQFSITRVLLYMVKSTVISGIIGIVIFDTVRCLPIIMLETFIEFMRSPNEEPWKGYTLATFMFLVNVLAISFARHVEAMLYASGLNMKSILTSAIFRKLLRISNAELAKYTSGDVVNLIAVDADKVTMIAGYLAVGVSSPVNLAVVTYLLYRRVGVGSFALFGCLMVLIPITVIAALASKKAQVGQMNAKDDRIKFVNESFSSIKVLKLYGWEEPFVTRVEQARETEINHLRIFAICTAALRTTWSTTPFIMTFSVLAIYVFSYQVSKMTADVAFVVVSFINTVRFSVTIIPELISNGVQCFVALRRINDFLKCKDQDTNAVQKFPGLNVAVRIEAGHLSWTGYDLNSCHLRFIDIVARKKSLIMIVGKVGSGKSSVLGAILGQMNVVSGRVDVDGKISYAPQTPFLFSGSVRKNVTFMAPYHKVWFNMVVDKCCLRNDLLMLPNGEKSELVERGANLSGGQKQRVGIARAVYNFTADVFLFDDPLSALDSNVATQIFTNVFGADGLLRNKTRIMTTNTMSVVKYADYVYVMDGGHIVEHGTYSKLLAGKGEFTRLMSHCVNEDPSTNCPYRSTSSPHFAAKRSSRVSIATTAAFQNKPPSAMPNLEPGRQTESHSTRKADSPTSPPQPTVVTPTKIVQDEQMETGRVKLTVYLNYMRYMGVVNVLLIIAFFVIGRLCDMFANLWLSDWSAEKKDVDINTAQGSFLRNMRMLIWLLSGFGQGFFSFIGCTFVAVATIQASTSLHSQLLISLMHAPMTFFDTTPMGRIANRFGKDMDQLDIQLPSSVTLFLELFCQVLLLVIVVGYKMPLFVASIIPAAAIYFLIQKIYLSTLRQAKRLENVSRSPVYETISETLCGLHAIRAYKANQRFLATCYTRLDVTQRCSFAVIYVRNWMSCKLNILGNALILLVSLFLVNGRGRFTASDSGFMLSYMMGSMFAFNYLVHFAAEVETAIMSSERMEEYTNVTPEAPWTIPAAKPPQPWPSKGAVRFSQYSTRYRPGMKLCLNNINIDTPPGQKIGVVGRTGAGKSTLTLALFRILEACEGLIIIDGVDISKIGLHDLRKSLTIIPQEPALFSGTLRFNLDPEKKYTDEQIMAATRMTNIDRHYAEGLNEIVEESGSNLSLGERQLVCLTRAILKCSKVLVLDEATAAIDAETDSLIQRTIRQVFRHSTTITIAHRLNTILDSDRIIVMAGGVVIEDDKPENLLRNPRTTFYSMAKSAGIV